MPPLSYEKEILRSFVPTWRESLILYFKHGTLDKRKNHSLSKSVGTSQRVDSDFQNGLAIISSGIDTSRLLFYLLFYIANPLHIYENDSSVIRFNPNQFNSDTTDTNTVTIINSFKHKNGKRGQKRQKIDDYENSANCENTSKKHKNGLISDKSLNYSNSNYTTKFYYQLYNRPGSTTEEDELYNLSVKNSNLVLKSNSLYRKIFSMSESDFPNLTDRMHLFSDVNVQSTVTIYSHLVFVLGFEITDFENYETAYKYLTNKLFIDREKSSTGLKQLKSNPLNDPPGKEYCKVIPANSDQLVLPKLVFIDGSVVSSSRQQLYVNGGYFCINTRVLLNDILTSKILPEIIGGIVVMNAHQITEDCNIAFVIRLLRMRNKVAFVKAISNNVHCFKGHNLTYCLKNVFTKNVNLFPRCHQSIENVLNDTLVQPVTFEVSLPLSEIASEAYNSILKIIWTIVQSMKRLKYEVDMNKIVYTTNKLLIRLLRKQAKSTKVYHHLQNKTQNTQLSSKDFYIDVLLKFRRLLDHLLYTDPITFLEELDNIITENSNWVCTPNGIKLFKKSNERLFKIENDKIELNIEKNLKLEYIVDILRTPITNEQLVQIIKSNFKRYKIYDRVPNKHYNQFYIRNYLDKLKTKRKYLNLSVSRRRLVRIEKTHLMFFNKHFNSGRKLKRNVVIIVENFYLVDYLTKYFKCPDYHLTRLIQYLQSNLYHDSSVNTRENSSFISEYYTNINKKILNKSNIYNLYKILLRQLEQSDVNVEMLKSLNNVNNTNSPQTNNTPNVNKIRHKDKVDNEDNGENEEEELESGYVSESESDNEVFSIINEKPIDVNELMNYIDITVDFDKYIENSVYIVKSYSNINTTKIDKYDRLMTTLLNVNPCIILIYSPNVHVFRTIENYCAHKFARGDLRRKKMNFLQVHVLSYKDCLETHRFAKCLKSEVDAWSSLQNEKKSQVVRLDEGILLNRASLIGQVIVDTREMHCKLPFYLFNLGINVVPNVLEIGDYLITRDICIERKSFMDLQISLNNARLAKQISEMCSAYNNPFLLIEFEDEDLFHLPSTGFTKGGYNYIYIKLVILCCNFPKLRLIWSSSPKHSANIIKYLKANRTEPDLINNDYLIKNFRNRSEKLETRPETTTDNVSDNKTDHSLKVEEIKTENLKPETSVANIDTKTEDLVKAKVEDADATTEVPNSNANSNPNANVNTEDNDENINIPDETEKPGAENTTEVPESNPDDTTESANADDTKADDNVDTPEEAKPDETAETTVENVNPEPNVETKDPEDTVEDNLDNNEDEPSETVEKNEVKETVIGLKRPEFVKNRDALKILRNIPGVTSHNLSLILTRVKSLLHLSELSLKELCNFLPESEARLIHDYFNMPINLI
ncbi:ERCC4 domain protein [Theileria parva strain Muguga]|uniref:DNA repair endonuclease, putative n=1 Tax=Theileria parva TaxID=5875 RepID=Q4MZW4_THEPA|nr:ERCC4 domain protein [Theileria parva strain Muguga]EAN31132.1 ERCC4 domain protein [Theileria parva strain Muguga]|eukprot:XP_763415.1 DNA repair endonuclease [Theileria parva strain Muguga]